MSGYTEWSQHGDANRDIGGAQLGSQVLPLIDKLARVNSAGVEPDLATTRRADQAQQPTRAGKSLSQRPVTIQVKPQDILIIFRRTGTLEKSSDRKPQISQEELSRIFKIYDSTNMRVISEPGEGNNEPEVPRDLNSHDIDMIVNKRDDESSEVIVDEQALEQLPIQSGVGRDLSNNKGFQHRTENQREEMNPRKTKSELKPRKPEGRSLNINSTEYKFYIKEDEVINKEVVEINDTKTNLIHKAVVINRPLYDHSQRVEQESSLESPGSSMKKTIIKISQSNMIGIGLGVLLFLLTLTGETQTAADP